MGPGIDRLGSDIFMSVSGVSAGAAAGSSGMAGVLLGSCSCRERTEMRRGETPVTRFGWPAANVKPCAVDISAAIMSNTHGRAAIALQ
jgi:hypothetical protein